MRIKSETAVRRFMDKNRGPINMFNIGGYKQNPVPSCLADLLDYDFLTSVDGENGKKITRPCYNLRESAAF
jgi:hypothetical protein